MREVGLAQSTSEARRLIEQGGVTVDRLRVASVDHVLATGEHLIQVGKRRFLRVLVEGASVGQGEKGQPEK
jgi:tyrosyl-tRNA synthetase